MGSNKNISGVALPGICRSEVSGNDQPVWGAFAGAVAGIQVTGTEGLLQVRLSRQHWTWPKRHRPRYSTALQQAPVNKFGAHVGVWPTSTSSRGFLAEYEASCDKRAFLDLLRPMNKYMCAHSPVGVND